MNIISKYTHDKSYYLKSRIYEISNTKSKWKIGIWEIQLILKMNLSSLMSNMINQYLIVCEPF